MIFVQAVFLLNFFTLIGFVVAATASVKNFKSSLFIKNSDTDIVGLLPIDTMCVRSAPHQCSSQCNRNEECDAFTSQSNESDAALSTCKLYAILRDNYCIANVTKVTSVGTSLYQKRMKGINATCKASTECTINYGLECIKRKCICNESK